MLLYNSLSGCGSAGRVRGLGPWGRRFESSHPDHFLPFFKGTDKNLRKFKKHEYRYNQGIKLIMAVFFNFYKYLKIPQNINFVSRIDFTNFEVKFHEISRIFKNQYLCFFKRNERSNKYGISSL